MPSLILRPAMKAVRSSVKSADSNPNVKSRKANWKRLVLPICRRSINQLRYERARNGEHFTNLMPLVLSEENILLAYRNIKNDTGSKNAGTDKFTISDIGKITPKEVIAKVRYIVSGTKRGYRPKPVRRKEIPKPNGTQN